MWSSAVTTELHYERGWFPAAVLLRVGAHFTRNMRVSQSKHAHLHKNAVMHTLAALGCGCNYGSENEASPASQLASH